MERHKIRKEIENLKKKRAYDGHSTTLVTLIIPAGSSVNDIKDLVAQERSTAENIKSKKTRKHVKSALQSIHRRLKKYREFPENGLIIYCGITQDGSMDFHEIVPPRPIQRKRYLCDSHFHTGILEKMVERKRKYGVILVERDNATLGLLIGSKPEVLKDVKGYVPSKHGKGGQSQARFERLIEEQYNKFLKKVAGLSEEIFSRKDIEGILLAGPAYAKDELESYLSKSVKKKVIGKVKTQYMGKAGLRETLNKGSELIKQSRYAKEKKIMDRVMDLAGRGSKRLTFGFDESFTALQNGRVETLIVSEGLEGRIWKGQSDSKSRPKILIDRKDKSREAIRKVIQRKIQGKDGKIKIEKVSEDPIEYLLENAKKYDTEVKLISKVGEPNKILSRFNGIVGILRY